MIRNVDSSRQGREGSDFAYFNGCFVENVFEWERDMLKGYGNVLNNGGFCHSDSK